MVVVLTIDGAGDRLQLEELEDLLRFHVRIEGGAPPARIAAAFAATGLGRFESMQRAMVSVDRVRRLAAGRVDAGWDLLFDAMLAYAASRGWYDAAAGAVQAHCETAGG